MEAVKRVNDIGELLIHLGVNKTYVGYHYIVYGISRACENHDLLTYISKGLYVEMASQYHTSVECVERNLRTVIQTIWSYGDRRLLYEVFGYELKDRPCGSKFIKALLNYVQKGNGK